jgi:hypothetical protein
LKKIVLAAVIMGALFVTGCTAQPNETKPTASSSTSPSTSETPVAETLDTATKYGDVHAYKLITDDAGEYAATTINEDAAAYNYNPAVVDAGATSTFSEDEILAAQRVAVKFVAEEAMDSIALDSTAGWEEWKTTVGPKVFYPSIVNEMIEPVSYDAERSTVIENNYDENTPKLVRDSKPRTNETLITVDSVLSEYDERVGDFLRFKVTANAKYRVSDEVALEYFKANTPDVDVANLKTNYPVLYDGIENATLPTNNSWDYIVVRQGNDWIIGGFVFNGGDKNLIF